MMRKRGFTLVELLVVIAIITILAATVVPRVSNWIGRARLARAVSEIKNADLALTKMLADTQCQHFGQFFPYAAWANAVRQANFTYKIYSDLFYELLRRGRDADTFAAIGVDMKPDIKKKLGTSYMDIGKDPWGNNYQFYAGPCPNLNQAKLLALPLDIRWKAMPWRANKSESQDSPFIYTQDAKGRLDADMRGNPPYDELMGFPASPDSPVFIYSLGADGLSEQQYRDVLPDGTVVIPHNDNQPDGGDDVNNWDPAVGWSNYYS